MVLSKGLEARDREEPVDIQHDFSIRMASSSSIISVIKGVIIELQWYPNWNG